MVRHVEVIGGFGLEALRAVPGHVLDHEQSAIGNEDVIQDAVGDDCAVEALDDMGQHRQTAGRRSVAIIADEHALATFLPLYDGCVDSFLHVGTVEVDLCAGGEVVEGAGKAENVPEQGAGSGYLVDVEARVDEGDGVVNIAPQVAFMGFGVKSRRVGKRTRWWIDKVVGEEVGVATGVGLGVDVGGEG